MQNRSKPLNTCLATMGIVKPRTISFYTPFKAVDVTLNNYLFHEEPDTTEERFSLLLMYPRLGYLRNPTVDVKILVVGASDCGISFLEHLLLEYIFKNIVKDAKITISTHHSRNQFI